MKRKYFKSKSEAIKACKERAEYGVHVFKMPKGTRKAGQYAVCTELEFLNTY